MYNFVGLLSNPSVYICKSQCITEDYIFLLCTVLGLGKHLSDDICYSFNCKLEWLKLMVLI